MSQPFHNRSSQIVDALLHYRLTGEIQEVLYHAFDQKGKWHGLMNDETMKLPDRAFQNMKKLTSERIDPEKLVKTNSNGETTLLSAYIAETVETLELGYHHVAGCMNTTGADQVSFPNLKSIGGYLYAVCALNIDAPQLEIIKNDLTIKRATTCHFPELKSVGGKIDADRLETIEFPKLEHIQDSLEASTAKKVLLPSLRTAGGIILTTATEFQAGKLEEVKGSIYANQVTKLHIPSLKSVTGAIDTTSAKNYYDPKLIVGELWAYHPEAKMRWVEKEAKKALKQTPEIEI